MEIAATLIPVVEHPALAAAAVHRVHVPRGAVGVAVDEPRVAVLAQDLGNHSGRDHYFRHVRKRGLSPIRRHSTVPDIA